MRRADGAAAEVGHNNGSARPWAERQIGSRWNFNRDGTNLIYRVIAVLEK